MAGADYMTVGWAGYEAREPEGQDERTSIPLALADDNRE